jgi:uncharacterized protein
MPKQIEILLQLVPDNPSAVLSHLSTNPGIAKEADDHGYSLLHAACSYNQLSLMRALVEQYGVETSIVDEDGDTPLFFAETEAAARCLVDLGADISLTNDENQTAFDRIREEVDESTPEGRKLLEYIELKENEGKSRGQTHDNNGLFLSNPDALDETDVHPPPPLPQGVKINIGSMVEDESEPPDPEIRRRIDELAARPDFDGNEAQGELRDLIADIVKGVSQQPGRDVRQRTD